MQYILTQAEYDALRAKAVATPITALIEKDQLQKLCTDAANYVPVAGWSPSGRPHPWGCVLDKKGHNYNGYCDDCPAVNICPHTDKDFSK